MAAFVLAVGLILIAASTCHVVPEHEDLDAAVRAALWDFKGSVGIYAEDLDSGRVYGRNEDHLFPTASVFKVPVMIEFFRRVESVELLTDQTQEWAGGISRHGSGVLKEREHPGPLPLLELCRLMIAHSDNIATDTLMQVVSAASVSATMDEFALIAVVYSAGSPVIPATFSDWWSAVRLDSAVTESLAHASAPAPTV